MPLLGAFVKGAVEGLEDGLGVKGAMSKYRRDVSRLASVANKRIERLKKSGLESTPAYERFMKDGGDKFGVKGKTYNEVQSEVARLNRFLNAQTSTIKGANKVLKEIADNTGIKYKNIKELRNKAPKFFELSSKVEQYLRTIAGTGASIGYNQVWEAINEYTEVEDIDLSNGTLDIEQMVSAVSNMLTKYEKPLEPNANDGWYRPKG